ncbi:uncharacterized protein LOC134286007 [Aedes albopictus]|uniref:CCHC-type domain-containing protein n=1 Tax=Aedes albopictus TaxID=7160 RepID=A0ABM1Z0F9_AEDAL
MSGRSPGPPGGSERTICRSNVPEWMLGPDDLGQVIVLVLRRKLDDKVPGDQQQENAALPDSIIVGASIELMVGVKEARTISASREGRGTRYILRTSSKTILEKLTKITKLTDGTEVEIVHHPTLNTVQGIVYDTDTINKDENLILDYLKPQGVHAVRRIRKRVNGAFKNTPLLVLSFHGTTVPDIVYFGLLRKEVRGYYPSPMICYNCGYYGHSKKICQQPSICLRCAVQHDVPDGEHCVNPPNCLHCKTGHQTTSRDCPKYQEEEKIVRLKVDKSISITEARRLYAEENKRETFATVVQEQIQQQLAAKDLLIATLQQQVATLTKELAALKEALKSFSHSQPPSPHHQQNTTTTQKPSSKAFSSTHVQQIQPPQTERLSRKDQSGIPPQQEQRENRKNNRQQCTIMTRSRSNKRHMEFSPTEIAHHQGKRTPAPSNKTSTSINAESNNGPGTS